MSQNAEEVPKMEDPPELLTFAQRRARFLGGIAPTPQNESFAYQAKRRLSDPRQTPGYQKPTVKESPSGNVETIISQDGEKDHVVWKSNYNTKPSAPIHEAETTMPPHHDKTTEKQAEPESNSPPKQEEKPVAAKTVEEPAPKNEEASVPKSNFSQPTPPTHEKLKTRSISTPGTQVVWLQPGVKVENPLDPNSVKK